MPGSPYLDTFTASFEFTRPSGLGNYNAFFVINNSASTGKEFELKSIGVGLGSPGEIVVITRFSVTTNSTYPASPPPNSNFSHGIFNLALFSVKPDVSTTFNDLVKFSVPFSEAKNMIVISTFDKSVSNKQAIGTQGFQTYSLDDFNLNRYIRLPGGGTSLYAVLTAWNFDGNALPADIPYSANAQFFVQIEGYRAGEVG